MLSEFVDLVPNLARSVIFDGLNFKDFATYLSKRIDESFLDTPAGVHPADVHTSIFLNTIDPLYYDDKLVVGRENAFAIAALMSGASLSNISSKTNQEIIAILGKRIEGHEEMKSYFLTVENLLFIHLLYGCQNFLEKADEI